MVAKLNFTGVTNEDHIIVYKDYGVDYFDPSQGTITIDWTLALTGIDRPGESPPPFPGGSLPMAFVEVTNVLDLTDPRWYDRVGAWGNPGGVYCGLDAYYWSPGSPPTNWIGVNYLGDGMIDYGYLRSKMDEGEYATAVDYFPKTYMRIIWEYDRITIDAFSDSARTVSIDAGLPIIRNIDPVNWPPDYRTPLRYLYAFSTMGYVWPPGYGPMILDGYVENMTIDMGSGAVAVDFDEFTIANDPSGKITLGTGLSYPVTGDPVLDDLLGVQEDQDGQLVFDDPTCSPCSRANYVQYQRDLIDSMVADGTYTAAEGRSLKFLARTTRGSNGKVINHP